MNNAKERQIVHTMEGYSIKTAPAETMSFVTQAGATDAGEVAGTIVYGKLSYSPVLNLLGDTIGEYNSDSNFSSSISFTTGVLDSTKEVGFCYRGNLDERLSATAALLTVNGQWACDYDTGLIVVKKASAAVSQVITSYKYRVPDMNLASLNGTTVSTNLGDADAGTQRIAIASDQLGLIGGGATGGGNNTYSTEQGDFTATVTAPTNIVLNVDSIGGVAIDENHFANGVLKVWDASTEEMISITLDDFTWTAATKTLAVGNCTNVFTFATGDIVSLTITGPDKMRDSSTDAQRASLIRDVSDQYTYDTFTLTNVPNATPDETIIIDLSGYKGWSVHLEKTGGADTFDTDYFVSNEDALSTADWLEITPTFASGSATADHLAHPASELLKTKALKLMITTAGGANDMDAQIFVTRWY